MNVYDCLHERLRWEQKLNLLQDICLLQMPKSKSCAAAGVKRELASPQSGMKLKSVVRIYIFLGSPCIFFVS